MKTILIILDGISEEPLIELYNKTPIEYANTKNLDKIKNMGCHLTTSFCPKKRQADSLTCISSILGVQESSIPKNRSYLELISQGIDLEGDEIVFRCNIIKTDKNILESFNGEGLLKEEKQKIFENLYLENNMKFYYLSDYKGLLVIKNNDELVKVKTFAPHEHLNENIDKLLVDIKKSDILNKFISNNKFLYNKNKYIVYPWGGEKKCSFPQFDYLYNRSCLFIGYAEIAKGIASAMGIDIKELKECTGDIDTNLCEKLKVLEDNIEFYDDFIIHINGTDEISHRKDIFGKVKFLEKIDREFLETIYNLSKKNIRVIIVSDHQTSSKTGKHENGKVDYISNVLEKERGIRIWQR